jgi:hypothetical protein
VKVEGSVPFDIAFGHPRATLSALDWMQNRIGQIIERFADAFPSDPHQA